MQEITPLKGCNSHNALAILQSDHRRIKEMTQAIIFDAFGSLASITKPTNPFKSLIKANGVSKDSFEGFVHSRELSVDQILAAYGADEKLSSATREKLTQELCSIEVQPGAYERLRKLDRENTPWIIISKSPSVYAYPLLKALGISSDKVIFSWEHGDMMPHLLSRARTALGVPFEKISFIGGKTRENMRFVPQTGMEFVLIDQHHNAQDIENQPSILS